MASRKRMGEKAADVSDPSVTVSAERPCDACWGNATADPCGPCPLYRAYLERSDLADTPSIRASYDAWATAGGWRIVWGLHLLAQHRAARLEVMALRAAYPRVDPAIVARMLGVTR